MIIGVPREILDQEGRVGVSPSSAVALTRAGHRLLVQQGAGQRSGFRDDEYIRAGAEIVATLEDVYARAELLWKVEAPMGPELDLLRRGHQLLAFLHLGARPALAQLLEEKGVLVAPCENIRLPGGVRPIQRPMSEIAGRMAVQVGARCLESASGGRGLLLGGVPGVAPARVAILGCGTAGRNALRAAVGFGADVTVLDNDPDRLRPVDDTFSGRVRTLDANATNLEETLMWADLLIAAVRDGSGRAPRAILRDQLGLMKPGAVVVDLTVAEGGCLETTRATSHTEPTYELDGIVHYAVPNMTGAVARTATPALAQAMLPWGLLLARGEGLVLDR